MAFDQTTRNRLARFVSDARALLTEEFTRQLQNEYGLDPASGEVTPIERLTALDDRRRETAHILRETLDYYLAGNPKADAKAYQDVLDRIVREQAFTVLNRLCALRMSEARGLVLESITKGYQSKGFQLYARLAGSALGETGEAYRMYLFGLMDEFAVDLPLLFDRFSPQGRLFPREAILLKLLVLINDVEIEPLWTEDETIGWIYQYFNSKEERRAMRDASQAPRNSRELAVRNQFFTPRYVVEFLTDNTLGRIWYEMTRGETVLKDSCRYLVRRKHSFFLEEGQEAPEPFLPEQRHETDPDLAHEMWLPPNDQITDLYTIFLYGLTAGGYDYARKQWGIECGDLANEKLKQYHETGKWEGTFDELRCCLFFEQRRYHHFGERPEGDDAKAILGLYQAICERWNLEVEYIPHRPLKDPREIKMLDPACGSMHFGLYAFDLFEQIYAEAWELEERLGEDALKRLPDLDSLHKTYPDQESYLNDVPRLIIEFNIHGVDIDPRAVQIAGLSLWLRAQKSWQAQGLRPGERPQIYKSNVVCAEPMPGDRQMLEEFLSTLHGKGLEVLMRKAWRVPTEQKVRATPQMADALAKLVRTVWQEMELAGEAGSLLKIEETLRDAIATARKEAEEKSPLFRVLEYEVNDTPYEQYVQLVAGEDQGFFGKAEGLVLAALKDYAEQAVNGESYQRRLFAGDASQGFAFIDLCRKRYDLIVMNPPFGSNPVKIKQIIEKNYSEVKNDLAAMFIQHGLDRLSNNGELGALTTRNILTLGGYQDWRIHKLLKDGNLRLLADLGYGVLDDAMVEVAAYTISARKYNLQNPSFLISCLGYENKEERLSINITDPQDSDIQIIADQSIINVPGAVISSNISASIINRMSKWKTLELQGIKAKVGVSSGEDERFLRTAWEVPPINIGQNKNWSFMAKGGEWYPFWGDFYLLVLWKDNGYQIKTSGATIRNSQFYFAPGITYPERTTSSFGPRVLPEGCIFSTAGQAIFTNGPRETLSYLGLFLSRPGQLLVELSLGSGDSSVPGTAARHYLNGMIARLPFPELTKNNIDNISDIVSEIVKIKRSELSADETSRFFISPFLNRNKDSFRKCCEEKNQIDIVLSIKCTELVKKLEENASVIFGFNDVVGMNLLEKYVGPLSYENPSSSGVWGDTDKFFNLSESDLVSLARASAGVGKRYITKNCQLINRKYELISHLTKISIIDILNHYKLSRLVTEEQLIENSVNFISYIVGCCFGRWNILFLLNERTYNDFPDPFNPLPSCPPGMLINKKGEPLLTQDELNNYPLRIAWNGILVDDDGHINDIQQRIRDVQQVIWGDKAEIIEQEICNILGVRTIREYFNKPSLFYEDHYKQYSKSRRAAPIYWQLSTPTCSYTLWLYYHRLNDQTIYTCVNDFVDPKLKQVSEEVARLRLKKGRSAADEKELERLTDFERELKDFREELLRVAKFWKPNLNDGVEITAAPLWKLFQHKAWQKRLKETWQKLEDGEYDWAHLAYAIWPERVREKCKGDKSLAIAHDLEELYVEPPASAKKKKAKKTVVDEETEGWFNDD